MSHSTTKDSPTTIDVEQTVAELVVQVPARAAVFEEFGIEYCCGGKVPLREAVADKGLDLDHVADLLVRAAAVETDERDWSTATIGELCEHIVDVHHGYLRRELPRLTALVAKVARAHGGQRPELVEGQRVFDQLNGELLDHISVEEQDLFPQVSGTDFAADLDAARAEQLVQRFEHDHTEVAGLLVELRRLYADYIPPTGACTSYRAMLDGVERLERDVHVHVHEENHVLFPRVVEALGARA